MTFKIEIPDGGSIFIINYVEADSRPDLDSYLALHIPADELSTYIITEVA